MSNPFFEYEVRGLKKFADPMRVRRLLLDSTSGSCWTQVQEARAYIEQVKMLQDVEQEIKKDLETTPATLEEMDEAKAQGIKDVNLLPRPLKLRAIIAQMANLVAAISRIEATLAAAAMDAFEFAPINVDTGEGVSENEALDILIQFFEYAEGKE